MEEFKIDNAKEIAQKLRQAGRPGILRLTPTWVPRSFCRPGRRIKLHPDDYYALGLSRGGIDERWFASTTHAANRPGTPDDEGLSVCRERRRQTQKCCCAKWFPSLART